MLVEVAIHKRERDDPAPWHSSKMKITVDDGRLKRVHAFKPTSFFSS